MQIPSPLILRLLRRSNLPPCSARMHCISPHSRSLLSSITSAPPRGWLPTLVRRIASVRAALDPRFPHGSRNMAICSGAKDEKLGKQDMRRLIPSAKDAIHTAKDIISVDKHFSITRCIDNEDNKAAIEEFLAHYGDVGPANVEGDGNKIVDAMYDAEDGCRTAVEVTDGKQDPRGAVKELTGGKEDGREQRAREVSDDVGCALVLPESSHRDNSLYIENWDWKREYCIFDRNQTRLEAMMLSDPSKCCILKGETCIRHKPCPILQIFSLKVAKIPVDSGSVELYGYIAARDLVDPLLNYIVNISRDDPIIVEQGSFIEMTGPKRGIEMSQTILLEYDMRIKLGDQEKDDLQLIDGVSIIDELITWGEPVTQRIHGNYGAVDFAQMCIEGAVEATVEVVISEVQSSFDLCLSCFTSGLDDEIRLFDGVIGEPRRLSRNVLAVVMGTCIDLKFKVGSGSDCCAEHYHSFKATNHGCATQHMKIELASISVKVTWSTLNLEMMDLL